mgnify:CR=1 FL=1
MECGGKPGGADRVELEFPSTGSVGGLFGNFNPWCGELSELLWLPDLCILAPFPFGNGGKTHLANSRPEAEK